MVPHRNRYGFPEYPHAPERGYFYERMREATFACLRAVALLALFLAVLFLLTANPARSEPLAPPPDLWKGVVGEAVGEGEQGMRLVAHVYKNRLLRGQRLGCVALKRKDLNEFINRQPKQAVARAKAIVVEVFAASSDPTQGATLYENVARYGFPKRWNRAEVRQTLVYRGHVFFVEKRHLSVLSRNLSKSSTKNKALQKARVLSGLQPTSTSATQKQSES